MTIEQNVILTTTFQCWWAAPCIIFLILVPQFLFYAMTRYFDTLIEDVKAVIGKFNHENVVELQEKLIEMVDLHWQSLK